MTRDPPTPEFAAAFRARAGAAGVLTFAEFMRLALYDPALGYYRQARKRVGYGRGTDFYTSSTSGAVFGELVAAACIDLLGGVDPARYTFVEVGVEAADGVLTGVRHPFGKVRAIRTGEALRIDGACIVFSNELFDAQPFHRYIYRGGAWRELGVILQNGALAEVELSGTTASSLLPPNADEGYVLDAPLPAVSLLTEIGAQPWSGLFLAFDYGRTQAELLEAHPHGTARAYRKHTQSNDLLAHPGDQDLTCHLCWDWLVDELRRHRFDAPVLQSQESFLIRHAGPAIAAALAADAAQFSARKLALQQLLHPAHLGQKFQALWARR